MADEKKDYMERIGSYGNDTNTKIIESFKAKMDHERTFLERASDYITMLAGSNTFLFINIIWFVLWLVINTGILPFIKPFDPFPFSFLTSAVSLEAILLAILVLISQNRSAKIADIREEMQLQVNITDEEETTKVIKLLAKLLKKNGINVDSDSELDEMLKPTDPEKIEKTIRKELDKS